MKGRRLPRAISRTADEMRAAAAALSEPHGAPAPAPAASDASDARAAPPPGTDNVIAMPPKPAAEPRPSPKPAAPAPPPAASPAAASLAARRRALADAVVRRHAVYAAAGGLIPLPVANAAGVAAIIVRMLRMLSAIYGVPFARERARAIAVGLTGGTMPTGLATVTASTLWMVVPAANLVPIAVASAGAAAGTRAIGRLFIEHFESGGSLAPAPAADPRPEA